jgi:hypothetical protein
VRKPKTGTMQAATTVGYPSVGKDFYTSDLQAVERRDTQKRVVQAFLNGYDDVLTSAPVMYALFMIIAGGMKIFCYQ